MTGQTLYLQEGRWELSGSTVDVAGNPNIAIGFVAVTQSGELWIIDEQVNELQNRYTMLPLTEGLTATAFNGVNGVLGELSGSFVFFDDTILCTYASADGHYVGCETSRMIDSGHYETRGALFRDGGHVSSWSYALLRA